MSTKGNGASDDVRVRRQAAGLTQENLARLARCSTSTVALVERGWRPSEAMAARLDKALTRAEARQLTKT